MEFISEHSCDKHPSRQADRNDSDSAPKYRSIEAALSEGPHETKIEQRPIYERQVTTNCRLKRHASIHCPDGRNQHDQRPQGEEHRGPTRKRRSGGHTVSGEYAARSDEKNYRVRKVNRPGQCGKYLCTCYPGNRESQYRTNNEQLRPENKRKSKHDREIQE